jgi:hypothetical protein
MKHSGRITVAALALFAPVSAWSANEANFNAKTAGDPAELCSATPDNGIVSAGLRRRPPRRLTGVGASPGF